MILSLFFSNHKMHFPGSGGVKGFLCPLTIVSANIMLVEATKLSLCLREQLGQSLKNSNKALPNSALLSVVCDTTIIDPWGQKRGLWSEEFGHAGVKQR